VCHCRNLPIHEKSGLFAQAGYEILQEEHFHGFVSGFSGFV
jgi:hypothetical protein